jgi:hypothetical protein
MRKARFQKQRAANFRRINRAGGFKLALIHKQLDKPAHYFVIRSCPDVLLKLAVKLRALPTLMLGENGDKIASHFQMALISRVDIVRLYVIAPHAAHR